MSNRSPCACAIVEYEKERVDDDTEETAVRFGFCEERWLKVLLLYLRALFGVGGSCPCWPCVCAECAS